MTTRHVTTLLSGILLLLIVSPTCVAAEKLTLEFLFADYTGQPWTEMTKLLVKEFNETHPYIQVELIGGTSGYAPLEEKMRVYIAAGQQLDIYENYWGITKQLARDGVFLDLIPLMQRDGVLSEYAADFGPPGAFETVVAAMGGAFVALPSFGTIDAGLLYHRGMFDQAGVAYPPVSWKWADFRAVTRKLTRDMSGTGSGKQYGFLDETNYLYQWMWQNGVDSRASQRTDGSWSFNYAMSAGRETIEFLAGLQRDGITVYGGDRVQDLKAERGAMRMGLFTDLKTLREMDVDASITRRPYNLRETSRIGESWFHLHLPRTGDNKREAAAWEFLKWRTSREIDVRAARIMGMFPWRQANLRSRAFREMLEAMTAKEEAMLMADYMSEKGRVLEEPFVGYRSGAYPPQIDRFIFDAIMGKIAVTEAVEKAEGAFFAELLP